MQGVSRTTGCKHDCRALAPGVCPPAVIQQEHSAGECRDDIAVLKGEVLQDAGGD